MTITGKIIEALSPQAGVSKSGNQWSKQEYVLETLDQYPKQICFAVMGERIGRLAIQVGQTLEVSIDIDSHQHNGRWYTSVTAWHAQPLQQPASPAAPAQPAANQPPSPWAQQQAPW